MKMEKEILKINDKIRSGEMFDYYLFLSDIWY